MNRPPAVLWIAVVLLLLVPTAAGRLLLDLAGGLLIALLALPLILSGLGWIGWKLLQSRMITCAACGACLYARPCQCRVNALTPYVGLRRVSRIRYVRRARRAPRCRTAATLRYNLRHVPMIM